LEAAVAVLGSQCGFISKAKHQFQNSVCYIPVGGRELDHSSGAAVAVRVKQPGEQGTALRDGRVQIRLRNVLWPKLPENSAERPVARTGRRARDGGASPPLREAATRCTQNSGEA